MPLVALDVTDGAAEAAAVEPCPLAWPVRWSCDVSTESPLVSGQAVEAATAILHALSGRQFGLCELTLRPCRDDCADGSWTPWPGVSWPQPALVAGRWYNLACGLCAGGCSCTSLSQTTLPAPVAEVSEVLVDGTALDAGAWRLDDARRLVRVDGGAWPSCNDLTLPDTAAGTWSVTAAYGTPVPVLGELAVGELACSLLPVFAGEDCPLPPNITQLVRQGVTIQMPDPTEVLANGGLGLRVSDLFIRTYNPHGLPARSRVYSVDRPAHRHAGV